jgi:hypothetical protein
MNEPSRDHVAAALAVLAAAIIPGDDRDGGAAAVDAGPRLALGVRGGRHAVLYADGLRTAESAAHELFGRAVGGLSGVEAAAVLARLVACAPGFFRQLRADVAALYLSDPAVCARIGFPGPSLEAGGYPDFDQPPDRVGGR